MKKMISLALSLVLGTTTQAVNYYISTSTGDDSRTIAQAQNPATPWKTINKFNSTAANLLVAGDSVCFNKGDIFYGALNILKSGTAQKPIVYVAYGDPTKATPVITGLVNISNWVDKGAGIWEGDCASCGTTINTFVLNGTARAMGRFPNNNTVNKGFLSFESHIGNTKITDNELTSAVNWTGAELVIRAQRWVIDRNPITNHSGNTITYTSSSGYEPANGFGYFIQNHMSTLDQLGEWYYNSSTKKIYVYFGTATPYSYSVQVSNVNNLFYIKNLSNIFVKQLKFTGCNDDAIKLEGATNVTVLWGSVLYAGSSGISAKNTSAVKIVGTRVKGSNNNGLSFSSGCNGTELSYNDIQCTSLIDGMGKSGNNTANGILINGDNNVIRNNTIDSTGYIGIFFSGNNVTIKNNLVNRFTMSKDDGAGIYTWTGASSSVVYSNRIILGNIVINGLGAGPGTSAPNYAPAEGIYMDDNASYVVISENTIANCGGNAVYLHNAHHITFTKNTMYNCDAQLKVGEDNLCAGCLITNNTIKNNIFFSKFTDQLAAKYESVRNDIANFGVIDSNYYCRPLDDVFTINQSYNNGSQVNVFMDLPMWQAAYAKDKASKISPVKLSLSSISGLVGSNKFSNGNFNTDAKGIYTFAGVGTVSTTWDNTNKISGGSLKYTYSSSTKGVSILEIPVGAVTAGKNYALRYSILGAQSDKSIGVYLMKTASPYTMLTPERSVKITNTLIENEVILTPTVSDNSVYLIFEVDESVGTFWLDNVQLYEATVTVNTPDDLMRLEYNSTTTAKTITLPGTFRDVKNNLYNGSIVLAPFSSAILMKVMSANKTITALEEQPPIAELEFNVYPNPAVDRLIIDITSWDEKVYKVEIYDLSGRLVIEQHLQSSLADIDLNNLNTGTYMVRLCNAQGNLGLKKIIKTN